MPLRADAGHARPEFAISLAIFGVLVAIGVPAWQRGSVVLGGVMIALAVALAGYCVVASVRER